MTPGIRRFLRLARGYLAAMVKAAFEQLPMTTHERWAAALEREWAGLSVAEQDLLLCGRFADKTFQSN